MMAESKVLARATDDPVGGLDLPASGNGNDTHGTMAGWDHTRPGRTDGRTDGRMPTTDTFPTASLHCTVAELR